MKSSSSKKTAHTNKSVIDVPSAINKVKLIKCATGFANIANIQGDIITVTPELKEKLISHGYATEI